LKSFKLKKNGVQSNMNDYVTRVHTSPLQVNALQWNALLRQSDASSPFMRHEYLAALHTSGSAVEATGWLPQFVSLYSPDTARDKGQLLASAPLYVKDHSYGEYIFDHAWARAYQEHRLPYYPKATVAVPYTPVPGTRYVSRSAEHTALLIAQQLAFCEQNKLSSLHALFTSASDNAACEGANLMARQTVQFHWTNQTPKLDQTPTLRTIVSSLPPEGARFALGRPGGETSHRDSELEPYGSFDHYLSTLAQDKRKKIRAERRKVAGAGVTWRTTEGKNISEADWAFFYRCYERTYLEHGNAPYLTPAFFEAMASTMPENWVMFTAQHSGQPIACSLIAVSGWGDLDSSVATQVTTNSIANYPISTSENCLKNFQKPEKIAYGRYWGALARVDSLHFEACYYQPLEWCIQNGYHRFEGGAQGEHKMARGLLPITAHSQHWLAHPQFADAVARFLEREGAGMENYMEHLEGRSPFRV
jgi:uncharacterized protein